MKCFRKLLLILFLFVSINATVYGQDDKEVSYAELVVLENENLSEFIDSLNLKNHCVRKGENWYIDYRRDEYTILSRSRIGRLVSTLGDATIYLTLIKGNVFFILTNKEENLPLRKTGFKVDLSKFLNYSIFSVEDSTYWILTEHSSKTEVIKEVLFGCN